MPDVNPQCRGGNGQRYHTRAVITHAQAKGMDWVGGYRLTSIASSNQHAVVYMNVPWFVLSAINIVYIQISLLLNTFHQFISVGLRKESGCMSRRQGENVMVVWGSGRRGPHGQRRDERGQRYLQLQVQLQQWNLTWLSPCQKPCQRNKLSSKTFSTTLF